MNKCKNCGMLEAEVIAMNQQVAQAMKNAVDRELNKVVKWLESGVYRHIESQSDAAEAIRSRDYLKTDEELVAE